MPSLFRRIRVVYLVLVLSIIFPTSASALPAFNNLVIFGDSLSDTGNATIALFDDGQVPPFQNVPFVLDGANADLVPGKPYLSPALPPGLLPRFSDGALWIEGLASGLGLSADPYLADQVPPFENTNFAVGGARTGPLTGPLADPPTPRAQLPSLLDQFNYLFPFVTGGIISPDDLYVVWGGGDDGRDIAKLKVDPDPSIRIDDSEATELIAQAVDNIIQIVRDLASAGASILVPNLPDLAVTPEAIDRASRDLPGLVEESRIVSTEFNAVLDDQLALLVADFPLADIIELDIFSLVNDVVSDPSAFGFSSAANCIDFLTVCTNPSEYVFLDGVHPTAAGHALIARAALLAVPEPTTIMLMALGLVGLGFVRRRRLNA